MNIIKSIVNSFASTIGRILAYVLIIVIVGILFSSCDVKAEMLPDFDSMSLGNVNICSRLTGSADITLSCYSSAYSIQATKYKTVVNGECVQAELGYAGNPYLLTLDNEKLTYFTFDVSSINPQETKPVSPFKGDRVYPGDWYVIDFYVTAFDDYTTFNIPSNKIHQFGGYVQNRYDNPYRINSNSAYPSPIDTAFRNVYKSENKAYTHLFYLFRLQDPPFSTTQLANYITVPLSTTNLSLTNVSLLGYRVQYIGDTQNALNFVTDNHDHRYTDADEFIYFDSCSGENPASPSDPINPGVVDKDECNGNLLCNIQNGIINSLLSLFVPKEEDLKALAVKSTELAENFGFIGETVDFFYKLIQSIISHSQQQGCVAIPGVTLKFSELKDLDMTDYELMSKQTYCFVDHPWLGNEQLITVIRTVITLFFVCLFINRCVKEVEDYFSGESDKK